MIYRDAEGKLLEIIKYNYINDEEYMKKYY